MKLLALDFDGVISDSAPESFVVAVRTYCALEPAERVRAQAEALCDASRVPSLDEVRACPLYAPFLEMMPLGNRAEDYAVELHALETGRPLADQAAFDAFKSELGRERLRTFHKRFYPIRHAMAERDRAAWHGLMSIYPGLAALLRRRADDCVLAIATAKDRHSVRMLLDVYGIAQLFPEGRVHDKETGVSKRAHLEALRDAHGIAFEQMLFVDDKVNHLDDVARLGVACGLAGWGYNGQRERLLARERGHAIFELGEFERQAFGA